MTDLLTNSRRQAIMTDDPQIEPVADPTNQGEWAAEPITWHVANYTPQNPFSAELVIETGATDIALSLDPTSLATLHDALGHVRAAQRAAILGEQTPSPVAPDDEPAALVDEPQAPAKRRARRAPLIILGCLVAAAVLYSMVAGAVLV